MNSVNDSAIPKVLLDLEVLDEDMARLLQKRWLEATGCASAELYLPAIIFFVTVLEGFLVILTSSANDRHDVSEDESQKLGPLIENVKNLKWINEPLANISHGLRAYRNYIHPSAQNRSDITFTESRARGVRDQVIEVMDFMSDRIEACRLQTDIKLDLPAVLFGRELERQAFFKALGNPLSRVITVTGPHGIGKTALVETSIRAHSLVQKSTVYTFHVSELSNLTSIYAQVERFLAAGKGKRLVVILHNVENNISEIRSLVIELTKSHEKIQCICTGTTQMDLAHELEIQLSGLTVESAYDFLLHELGYSPQKLEEIAAQETNYKELCREVDCIPLALRFLAGEIRQYSTENVRCRLRKGLAGSKLESSLAEAYKRLSKSDQILVLAVAMYSEPLTLELLVSTLERELPECELPLNKGFNCWFHIHEGRVFMLGTIRKIILCLAGNDDLVRLRIAQSKTFEANLFPLGLKDLFSPRDDKFITSYKHSLRDNIEFSLASSNFHSSVCACIVGLAWHYNHFGLAKEGRDLCERVRLVWPLDGDVRTISLHRVTAVLALAQGNVEHALHILQELLATCKSLTPEDTCTILHDIGDAHWEQGNCRIAEDFFSKALELAESDLEPSSERERLRSRSLEQLGNIYRLSGEPERSLSSVRLARSILEKSGLPGSGYEWIRAWMYLQEANSNYDLGLFSEQAFARWWQLSYLSAKDMQCHGGDIGLAFIAERALRTAVLQGERELVQRAYCLAVGFRVLTKSVPPEVDRMEYLNDVLALAEHGYGCFYEPGSESRLKMREELVSLLRHEYDRFDRMVKEAVGQSVYAEGATSYSTRIVTT